MSLILGVLDSTLTVLRTGFFGAAAVLAVVCGVDWLVRTEKLNPFGALARLMRGYVDPLIAPVERRVVRAGGLPSSAPWWALVAVVLAGIVVITVLDFLRGQIAFLLFALDEGPRGIYRLLVHWTVALLQLALIVRVILSWIPSRPGSWYVRWSHALSEPLLRPLRRVVPKIGMIDITPIVAWVLLWLVEAFLLWLV